MTTLWGNLLYWSRESDYRGIRNSTRAGIADQVLRWAIDQPAGLLGYLYVLEGSRLGATVLGPQAQRAFNLRDNHGCAYLTQDAEHAGQTWQLGLPRTSTV